MGLLEDNGIICRDGENARPRAMIQQQIASLISRFLEQSFNN